MQIKTFFNKKVELEYFFIKGKIEIDSDYFIEKIKTGVQEKNNLNHKTNVKGSMTGWNYFNSDEKFLNILHQFIEYIDDNLDLVKYFLQNSWGIELKKHEKSNFHNHGEFPWSGVLYLNDSNQKLIFPDIKQEVKPEPGAFCLFSGFLNHGCYKNKDDRSKFGIAFNMAEVKDW